jgi:hypothetical protein
MHHHSDLSRPLFFSCQAAVFLYESSFSIFSLNRMFEKNHFGVVGELVVVVIAARRLQIWRHEALREEMERPFSFKTRAIFSRRKQGCQMA